MDTVREEHFRSELMEALGENLRILRAAKGWSQQDLADRVQISRITMNRIEQGHRIPDFALTCRLADELGTSVDRLRESLVQHAAS